MIAMTCSSIFMVASSNPTATIRTCVQFSAVTLADSCPDPRNGTPLRADAVRNRERILAAARTALTAADDIDAVTMQSRRPGGRRWPGNAVPTLSNS